MLNDWRGYQHTGGGCVPFQEIIRIKEAEAAVLAVIKEARTEADARISAVHADARGALEDAKKRALAESGAIISGVETEASAEATGIHVAAETEVTAIRELTDARLDEAIAFVVREVTGHAPDR